jgi:Secretion system C-terminal sorting domain
MQQTIYTTNPTIYTFEVYPNPTSGEFSLIVEGDKSIKYDINVSNLQGRIVYKSFGFINVNKNIDLNLLAKGIYFVKAIVGEKVFFQKITKI